MASCKRQPATLAMAPETSLSLVQVLQPVEHPRAFGLALPVSSDLLAVVAMVSHGTILFISVVMGSRITLASYTTRITQQFVRPLCAVRVFWMPTAIMVPYFTSTAESNFIQTQPI